MLHLHRTGSSGIYHAKDTVQHSNTDMLGAQCCFGHGQDFSVVRMWRTVHYACALLAAMGPHPERDISVSLQLRRSSTKHNQAGLPRRKPGMSTEHDLLHPAANATCYPGSCGMVAYTSMESSSVMVCCVCTDARFKGTGWTFSPPSADAMLSCVDRALETRCVSIQLITCASSSSCTDEAHGTRSWRQWGLVVPSEGYAQMLLHMWRALSSLVSTILRRRLHANIPFSWPSS